MAELRMRHGAPGGSPSWTRVSHPYVDALRSEGIETFESCNGGDGHAYCGVPSI